ncbi:MAG: hypothetical protein C0429_14345 [Sphingopyxis sp.]|nr:hypothetical protein [Sphingopyxis sp.]
MRIFQNSGVYRSYRTRLRQLTQDCQTFDSANTVFLNDRFGAAHFLKPILEHEQTAFFANGDDEYSQRLWASENGLNSNSPLEDILIAQIEHHRTEVFYNMDPMRFGDSFLARLPGCVRKTLAWRAAPSEGGEFLKHDLIVNNFPGLLEGFRQQGARAEYFFPAHDPEMDAYASNTARDIDILFVGSYSQYHKNRAMMLEALAALHTKYKVRMHLDRSRLTKLAETPLGWMGPLRKHRRALNIRTVSSDPVFGRDLLNALGRSKMVINGAIDMSLNDRGNMRVWEAMGCGAALISDEGRYPNHLNPGVEFQTYKSVNDLLERIDLLMDSPDKRSKLSQAGYAAISHHYSKQKQWDAFVRLAQ